MGCGRARTASRAAQLAGYDNQGVVLARLPSTARPRLGDVDVPEGRGLDLRGRGQGSGMQGRRLDRGGSRLEQKDPFRCRGGG